MTMQTLEKICDDRDEVRNAAIAMAEADSFDPQDPTFLDLQSRAQALDARAASLSSLMEQRSAADALDGRMAKQHQVQQREHSPAALQQRESWGETFVRSEAFQSYRFKGSSGIVAVDEDVQTRALPMAVSDLIAAGLTGAKHTVDVTPPLAPTPLLDNVTQVSVSGNAIEYVAWQVVAGGAAVVAEGAVKPSMELGPVVVPDVLQNVAVWTSATRMLLEDFSAVRSLIDSEIRREISRKEEELAVGVVTAATLPTVDGDDLLSAIRLGVGVVQSAGYAPDAVMLNPADYAALDISVLGATLLGPQVRQSFWGLTPIPANSQAEGTATVGSFRTAIQHFTRSGIQLFLSDSHGELFIANTFVILGERRSKTAVVRPQALVECSAA